MGNQCFIATFLPMNIYYPCRYTCVYPMDITISKKVGKFHLGTTLPLLGIIVPTKASRNIKFCPQSMVVKDELE
jgi:hypothetical protein